VSSEQRRSELECTILAMVGQGKSSGYAIKRAFQRLGIHRWNVESGSIHRALKRLEAAGALESSQADGESIRRRRDFKLTELGRVLVRDWLASEPAPDTLWHIVDACRDRALFWAALTPEERRQCLADWLRANAGLIGALRQRRDALIKRDAFWEAAYVEGFMTQAQARQSWLGSMAKRLGLPVTPQRESSEPGPPRPIGGSR
jgi:DNA-binding PadR family transcriptional regulator